MKDLKDEIIESGITLSNLRGTIRKINQSKSKDGGIWLSFDCNVFAGNKLVSLPCKLYSGISNTDYIKQVDDFANNFVAGDYKILGATLRVKGESYGEGSDAGTYKSTYVAVDYTTSIEGIGEGAILSNLKDEVEFKKVSRAAKFVDEEA